MDGKKIVSAIARILRHMMRTRITPSIYNYIVFIPATLQQQRGHPIVTETAIISVLTTCIIKWLKKNVSFLGQFVAYEHNDSHIIVLYYCMSNNILCGLCTHPALQHALGFAGRRVADR